MTSFWHDHRAQARHLAAALAVALMASGAALCAQANMAPTNDLPNPYKTVAGWAKLPEGRAWGSTSAVDIGAINDLATMPPKEEIFAKLLYLINAPGQRLVVQATTGAAVGYYYYDANGNLLAQPSFP